jgi:hypothetical protein
MRKAKLEKIVQAVRAAASGNEGDIIEVAIQVSQDFGLTPGETQSVLNLLGPTEARIRALEAEGMTRSDAQGVAEAEIMSLAVRS